MQAGVIFGAVTLIAIGTWYVTPEDRWLRREHIKVMMEYAERPVEPQRVGGLPRDSPM